MKKQTLWLLLIGAHCMAFPLLVDTFYKLPDILADFTKTIGAAILITSFILQLKLEKR